MLLKKFRPPTILQLIFGWLFPVANPASRIFHGWYSADDFSAANPDIRRRLTGLVSHHWWKYYWIPLNSGKTYRKPERLNTQQTSAHMISSIYLGISSLLSKKGKRQRECNANVCNVWTTASRTAVLTVVNLPGRWEFNPHLKRLNLSPFDKAHTSVFPESWL